MMTVQKQMVGVAMARLVLGMLGIALISSPYHAVAQTFSGGDGTALDPYKIANLDNLKDLADTPSVWNANFIQTADIDAAATATWNDDAGWLPIGNNTTRFTGYYDGQGHTIANLWIDRPETPNVGLFGHVGNGTDTTYIENLGVTNATVKGARGSGALVGRVTGNYNTRVEACFAIDCTVIGDGATGGLVGSFNSYIENQSNAEGHRPRMIRCYAVANVSLSDNSNAGKDKFGALAGCGQKGFIQDSYARGSVTVPGGERIGGLVGCIEFRGQLEHCYATTTVSAEGGQDFGGLVGHDSGSSSIATACFWDTDTSGQTASPYGTGLSTANMKILSTYTNAGWDFVDETVNGTADIWQIDVDVNDGYPTLVFAPTPTHLIPQEPLVFEPTSPQTYGTTNTLTYTGGSGSGDVTFTVAQGPGIIVDTDRLVVTSGVGTVHVRVEKSADETYLMASTVAYVEAEPKTLTITGLSALEKVYDGTTTAQATGTPQLNGVVVGDDVSLSGTPVFTFQSVGPGADIPVTTTGYFLTGDDAENYSLEQPELSADITAVHAGTIFKFR